MQITVQNPLMTVIRDIASAAKMEMSDNFYLKVENPPYLPLVIEVWNVFGMALMGEEYHISIAHYVEQGGDLLVDPEMVLMDNGQPVLFKQGLMGYERYAYWRDPTSGKVLVNLRERRDQLSFARLWARNLRDQGFIQAARKLRATSQPERPFGMPEQYDDAPEPAVLVDLLAHERSCSCPQCEGDPEE